jgi:FMN-dependent oxidoreductase (nitrilotriacetate monooxygenase family)
MPERPAPLQLFAFVMNTASHIVHGTWRFDGGEQIHFNELDLWIRLAQRLDAAGFEAMFFADVIGLYGDYGGDWARHAELGMQIPANDPMVLLSALASHTRRLGFAITAGPIQEPPFSFARRLSTLDQVSGGRIGWNIVTSSLPNGWRNFGYDGLMGHDARYALAEEYLDVLYKLWEGSWDDGALLADRETGVYADPAHIHKINHVSEHFAVEGPHLVAPSPQRTPVLFQAGASETGREFAARHAEAQFIVSPGPQAAAALVADIRSRAVAHGRRRDDIRFFQGLSFVIGSTEAEARANEAELESQIDIDGMIAHFGGSTGIDLGGYTPDTPVDQLHTEGTQSNLAWLRESVDGHTPTLADVVQLRARANRVVGTPEQIADRLEQWREAGIDGINVINARIPGSYDEFIDQVLPELRRRGLAATEPATPGTLRRRLFGVDRVSERHPAARYRGAF